MPAVRHITAPAKVNLALAVRPPRPDGLHPIRSWMTTISLADDLTLTRLEDDRLSRYAILWADDAPAPTDIDWSLTRDLAVRAHRRLEAHVGRSLPIQMKLDKRIPVGAGLGGGSADAAAMLVGLRDLFDLDLDNAALQAVAAEVGSDVPFLITGGDACVSGTGDVVESAEPTPDAIDLVVLLPGIVCPTAEVYDAFDDAEARADAEAGAEASFAAVDALLASGPDRDGANLFNDLAPAALDVAPELRPLANAFAALAERPVHVSGSGSSLFVRCDDELHATHLAPAAAERLGVAAIAATTGAARRLADVAAESVEPSP